MAQFGAPGSPAFEAARRNFITSEAGYAIASFLLQVGGGDKRWPGSRTGVKAQPGFLVHNT